MFNIQGMVTVISGGTSGIGRAIAERFKRHGADVIALNVMNHRTIAQEMGCAFYQVDVSDESAMQDVFQQIKNDFDGIDCLINNAGLGDVGPNMTDMPFETVKRLTDVNQHGVYLGIKHGAPIIRDGGAIINTSSLAGRLAIPGQSAYSATKAAVEILTQSAAVELGARSIRVNAVAPAYVATDLGSGEGGNILCENLCVLERQASVEDVAGVYHFLASPESRYMTGQTLVVDGGWHGFLTSKLIETLTGSSQAPS